MVNQPEARWADLERDLDLGRAEDLAWALGYASWGDPDIALARDVSTVTDLDLPLNQTWSVVFLACVLRGWLPDDEQASERIGAFLPSSESEEARAIQTLIGHIEASSDPRLELMPSISGSTWPRVHPRDALSWALNAEADEELMAMPRAIRAIAQSTTTSMSSEGQATSRRGSQQNSKPLSNKEINALFIMFLAISYARWDLKTPKDADDYLEELQEELKEKVNQQRLGDFERSVIREALKMTTGRFRNIIVNAQDIFSKKANPLNKASKHLRSLGSARTP